MARFYNHLNSDDLLRGLKEANGLKDEEKEKEQTEKCWRCNHINGFGANQCSRCSAPLNIRAITGKIEQEKETEKRFKKLERYERFMKLIETRPKLIKYLEDEMPKLAGNY